MEENDLEQRLQQLIELDDGQAADSVLGDLWKDYNHVRRQFARLRSSDISAEAIVPRIPGYDDITFFAHGGMGVVYKAHDSKLDRTVALKTVTSTDSRILRRFREEARAAARMDHPNIVPVYDVGEHGGFHFLVMAFIPGKNLRDIVASAPLESKHAAELIHKVAKAVEYAHSQGIIHRDVKPSNILIDEMGEPRLADFGLAKIVDVDRSLTSTGQVLGTPSYMPPEQASGSSSDVGPTADVYALGAVLYHLLTGRPPFQGPTAQATVLLVLQEDVLAPRKLNPLIHRDLETICLKCLRKEPGQRYASARELQDELQRSLRGEPIQARPLPMYAHAWRWCLRHPVRVVAAVGMFFAIAAVLFGTVSSRQMALRRVAEQAKTEAERFLYAAQMHTAHAAWQEGNTQLCLDVLKRYESQERIRDVRGFEWFYLNELCHSEVKSLPRQPVGVSDLAISADGRYFANSCEDGSITVWDANTLQIRMTLPKTESSPCELAFIPDGDRLATADEDGVIRVWSLKTRQLDSKWKAHADRIASMAFSISSGLLATASYDRMVRVWDLATSAEVASHSEHTDRVTSVAFNPSGEQIVSGSIDKLAYVWDIESKTRVAKLEGHAGPIWCVAYAPDGQHIATSSFDRTIRLWDAKSGQSLKTGRGHRGSVSSVTYVNDGRQILSVGSSDQTVKLWQTSDLTELKAYRGHPRPVRDVVELAPGTFITGCSDGTIRVWPLVDRDTLRGHGHWTFSMAFSPDGTVLATANGDKTVKLWDVNTSQLLSTLKGHSNVVYGVTFLPSGTKLATVGSATRDSGTVYQVKLWQLNADDTHAPSETIPGKLNSSANPRMRTFKAKEIAAVDSVAALYGLVATPDGKTLIAASADRSIIWIDVTDFGSPKVIDRCAQHDGEVRCVAISPDGKMIATGSTDRTVKIWDFASRTVVTSFEVGSGSVFRAEFSPDGKTIVAVDTEGSLGLWSVQGDRLLELRAHTGAVYAVAFTPDGRRVISGGSDETVRIWDVSFLADDSVRGWHQQPLDAVDVSLLTLHGHQDVIWSLSVSPSGETIASGSADKTIRLWRGERDSVMDR